ncbi:MAG: hypothetical protein ABFS19_01255 [Thermodesulfobacteriota bacterium]
MNRLKKLEIGQIGVIVICMLGCFLLAVVLPPLWKEVSGRDLRPLATTVANLLFGVSILLRGFLGWRLLNLVAALAIVEIILLVIIGTFTGNTGPEFLNHFNLYWLFFINLFTGLPWILGITAGSVWHARRYKKGQTGLVL